MKKKLIEVALPLEAINEASAAEKGNPFLKGHPRNLHQWWARRPNTAARAVIFAQMVDDPSSHPDIFKTKKAQEKERQRLFRIIEELVKWESNTNEVLLQKANDELWRSWRLTCAENADHPRASELFDSNKLPDFHDPFAGGGALPLEAQRLGLRAYASDLNPVAVMINKAMIEIPPKFAGKLPVNPDLEKNRDLVGHEWKGAQGLAEDVRYYGGWMRDEAEKRIGHLYPKVEVTAAMMQERPDLKKYEGQELTIIAYLWVRTVKSPNPAFANVDVPLASTFMLSNKAGKEAYVEPVIERGSYHFTVKVGKPRNMEATKRGSKSGGSGSSFLCLMSGAPMMFDYVRLEAKAGGMGARLMAIVAQGKPGRVYLSPTPAVEAIAFSAMPNDPPETDLPAKALGFRVQEYGMTKWRDLFNSRQLVALSTFAALVQEVREIVKRDATASGMPDDGRGLDFGGSGSTAYADAISLVEALSIDKLADYNNTICTWNPTNQNVGHLFTKQVIPMAWDYPETSPITGGLSFKSIVDGIAMTIEQLPASVQSRAFQHDCSSPSVLDSSPVISTDPPYYDNIAYADLSDFFYVWLRRSLKPFYPDLFATVTVPKVEELVATPYRHGSKKKAEIFFLDGMTRAMQRIAKKAHPAFPVTIYYAFKQGENDRADGTTNTGWDTFLAAVIEAGFNISGTWPIRTERKTRSRGIGSNALASSIILVCRQRVTAAPAATRREFVTALRAELPQALAYLQAGNIAPVDLAQAAIGPGMAVYTRYSKVLDVEGQPIPVRVALSLINETLDEAMAEQEGDFDADTRWAVTWFEQNGFDEGEYGVAEQLSKSKNTSVDVMKESGILASKAGKVRLLAPDELPEDWNPATESRCTIWEIVHHLVRTLESGGEMAAAELMSKLSSQAEIARELCYRLYTLCERKKRATEAMAYNSLVHSWPEIIRLSRESRAPAEPSTKSLFNDQ